MKIPDIWKALLAIAICELAGIIGSLFTVQAIPTWYADLAKPALNPPSFVFGPVWTVLYALMGIAAFLVWKKSKGNKSAKPALIIFGIQLALNAAWSIIFFGMQSPGLALVDIILMWIAIIATIFAFNKISRTAALLLLPYLLWVSFAMYLNYSIWLLN